MDGACVTGPRLRVGVAAAAAAVGEMNPTPQQQLGSVHIQQTTSPTWDAPGSFEGFAGGSDPAGLTLPCWIESFLSVQVMEWGCEVCAAVCFWASQEQMPACFCSLGPDIATWFYKPSLWLALQVVLAPLLLHSSYICQTGVFQALWWNQSGKICVTVETGVDNTRLCQWVLWIFCSCPLPNTLIVCRQLLLQREDQQSEICPIKDFIFEIYPADLFQPKCGFSSVFSCQELQHLTAIFLFQHMWLSGSSGQTCMILEQLLLAKEKK